MSQEVVVSVKGVSKDFILPHSKRNTVKSLFTSLFDLSFYEKNSELQHALKDITFSIKKGEFFGIVGRNGSGKSTLLKILAGIYQPTKGEIFVDGKLVPFIELGVGFNSELSGRDNIYLNGSLLGFSKQEIDSMYEGIVKFAELERFIDQKLKNYSSGMQVRLAFSMAIKANADVLLIDEVLAVGDADFQRKCFDYFKSLKKNKKTVIFVSHDMNAIKEYCDKVILIDSNKIIAQGSAEEVSRKYIQLFNDKDTLIENRNRWGDGTVSIHEPNFRVDSQNVEVSFKVKGIKTQNELVVGIAIKNAQGLNLVATNSLYCLGQKIKIVKDEEKAFKFKIPNIFNDGKYLLDIAIVKSDGSTVKDWWHDCVSAKIIKEPRLPSVVNPKVVMEMK